MHRFFSLMVCVCAMSVLTLACSPNDSSVANQVDAPLVLYASDHGDILDRDGAKIVAKSDGVYLSSTDATPSSGGKTGASHIIVPESFEMNARGNMVRITIEAKVDSDNISSVFGIAYSTAMAGNSGWQIFTPTSDFNTYSFDYAVSPYDKRPGNLDYIGINSDMTGAGRGIVVRSVEVQLIDSSK